MAYTGHTWSVNEAITRNNMNHMEIGIASAHTMSEENASNIAIINTKVGNGFNDGNLTSKVSSLIDTTSRFSNMVDSITNVISEVNGSHLSARNSAMIGTN